MKVKNVNNLNRQLENRKGRTGCGDNAINQFMLYEKSDRFSQTRADHVGCVAEKNCAVVLSFDKLVLLVNIFMLLAEWNRAAFDHLVDLVHGISKIGRFKIK